VGTRYTINHCNSDFVSTEPPPRSNYPSVNQISLHSVHNCTWYPCYGPTGQRWIPFL